MTVILVTFNFGAKKYKFSYLLRAVPLTMDPVIDIYIYVRCSN